MFKIKHLLIIFIFVFIYYFSYHYSSSLFLIGINEGYNLQIPLSLNENFIYQSRYEPRKIADPKITVGYPQHYLQFIFFKFFGSKLEIVRLYTASALIILLLLAYIYTKNIFLAIYLFSFYLISSWFRNDVSQYNGEVTTTVFLILSTFFLEKYKENKKNKVGNLNLLVVSSILFSMAVSNKIISLISLFLIFSFYKLNLKEKSYFLASAFFFFILSHILIITYSFYFKYKTIDGFKNFLITYQKEYLNTILINQSKIKISLKNLFGLISMKIIQFEGGYLNLAIFFIMPLIFLIFKSSILYGFISTVLLIKIFLTMFWRHYLIFLIFLFLLVSKKILFSEKIINKLYLFLIILVSIINISNFIFYNRESFFSEIRANNVVKQKQKEFAKKLDQIKGDIYSNGWWQGSSITFYTKKMFKNRMSFNEINNKSDSFLLSFSYQDGTWPFTDLERLCDKVVICEKDYILCAFKKGVYFNELGTKNNETKKCYEFKFD